MQTNYHIPTCPGCRCKLVNGQADGRQPCCSRCEETLAAWKRVTTGGQEAAEDQLRAMGRHYLGRYSDHEQSGWRIAVAIALSAYGNNPLYQELMAGRGRGLLRD